MKYHEEKHRRDAEESLIRAESVQKERMELESELYKAKLTE